MTGPTPKFCTPAIWTREATAEALLYGLEPGKLLAGHGTQPYVEARWRVWQRLHERKFSLNSVAKASSFDRTGIVHGILRLKGFKASEIRDCRAIGREPEHNPHANWDHDPFTEPKPVRDFVWVTPL